MASFLTDLAKLYVEKLINGAIAESSYICCFTCIAKDFEEEKARLKIERTTFRQRIEEATRRGEDIQGNALYWEEEADKLIQEDTKTKKKCCFEFCPHCIWRYRRGKLLANKKEHVKELMQTGKELIVGLPARLPDVERYSSQHYMHFKSRESKYIELLDELKDDNNYIIGLQGMGGTGKTTMIKEVGKKLKQSKQFTQIIDTTVSFSPNIKKIQDDIAGPLGLKFDDCNESDRPKKLWSRLTNGEKILLILDDVWGDIDFNEIGIPYSDNHKGCRIIVTTRSLFVCKKLGCNKIIQLDLLSEEDAWIMFKTHAGLSETSTKFFLDRGRKIANECKRLPIAIAVIASNLKGEQRQDEWDVALKSLQKHMSMHGVDDELVKIYKCLKFSYDNMKNEKVKNLFLLCSVFREDEEVLTERLVRLAIGGGLFGEDHGSYNDARSQVFISKNKLIDSCLLLEADQWTVKMHDLVRDAAQWIANKEIQTVQVYDKNQKAMVEREKNIKYLLCEGKAEDMFSCKLDGSRLEILIIITYRVEDEHDTKIEVPDSFFENNIGLRAFYFVGNNDRIVLSQSMQSLKNIRSLIFTYSNLGDISILGNLQSLETLDLDYCGINELPWGITKLEKFRLLKMDWCVIGRNDPFEVIERCSSLQELYFIGSFNNYCREITFPKVQFFCVATFYSDEFSSFKQVSFEGRDDLFLSETTLKHCMQEAEVLRLRRIEGGWRNIIPEIVPLDRGMNGLLLLDLSCISQVKCLIDTKHTYSQVSLVFSKLVKLHLSEMENLEELCNGPLSFDSFKSLEELSIMNCKHLQSLFKCNLNLCNLKKMSLERCPMLISLFELSTARSLLSLEILEIIDCERLECIIIDERKGEGSRREIVDDDSRSRDAMFQKLNDLNIEECPKLEIILPFVSARDLPALESITMKSCDKLKYIFGQDVKLGSLKNIKLEDVSNLIDIFPECNHATSLSIKKSSSISRSASKPATQSNPIKCNIFSWTDMYCCGSKLRSTTSTKIPLVHVNQPQNNLMESNSYCLNINIWERAQCLSRQSKILCNVTEIELTQLNKIKSIFVLSIAPKMMLETLRVKDCDELKHIIIDTGDHDNTDGNNLGNVFPKLKVLSIENCIQLEYIFGRYSDDHQKHIEVHLHLPALECLQLSNLQNLVAMCPKQYHISFPPLKELVLNNCLQVADMKLIIADFIPHHSVSRSADGTITKGLIGNMECLLALERLVLNKSKVQLIFCVNEVNEQPLNSVLQKIKLEDLYVMRCLFVGPKNSFALLNLTKIKIVRCEKLQVIFSDSILRGLPQLNDLIIKECGELKHIIEDDFEIKKMSNSSSSRTCFPKLKVLVVEKCNKLKCVFPISICNEFPELTCLIIREADELEEIFKCEGEQIQKFNLPNLNFVAIVNLPNLFQTHGVQFQTVQYSFVVDCQKLSFIPASVPNLFEELFFYKIMIFASDEETLDDLMTLFEQIEEESRRHNTDIETTKDFIAGIEVEATSRHELKSSQELVNEHSTSPVGETDATIKPSQENNLEGSTSEIEVAATLPIISEKKNEPTLHSVSSEQKEGIEINVEEGATSTNLELKHGDEQIAMSSFSIASKETNDQVSRNDEAFKNVSSNIEEQLPKKDDIIVSKSRPSSIASKFPSISSKGNPSKKVEDLSYSLLVTKELEQLVSKKYLASENLCLLTDFLVLHPSLHLKDTSLSNRYKGCAYSLLAQLLKFLQTHSVVDAIGSHRSEIVELLQDAHSFGFDKDWLNGVERRALFPDIQVLDSKQQVAKEFEMLRFKIDNLSQHVEDLKHQLKSSETVMETIIQNEADLSAPIGY